MDLASEKRSPSVNREYYDKYRAINLITLLASRAFDKIEQAEAIVAIKNGGVYAGRKFANLFDLPLITADPNAMPINDLPENFVVIEDVVDTGHVIQKIKNQLDDKYFNYRILTLIEKPWNPHSVISAEKTDAWCEFFWEVK